jgi:hypothetical protein
MPSGVQSALTNLDIDLFERLGNAYFSFNLLYDPAPSIKGDAKVKARGTSGLLEKEVQKQNAQDTLSFIAQLAQGGQVPPRCSGGPSTRHSQPAACHSTSSPTRVRPHSRTRRSREDLVRLLHLHP